MTPQEKAKALVLLFIHVPVEALPNDSNKAWIDRVLAKRCAHIAVDEIIESEPFDPFYGDYYETLDDRLSHVAAYWHQVKEEINKL